MANHTPGPWTWRDVSGAGLQISATLPAGFDLGGGHIIGKPTEIMTWTLRSSLNVGISDERWVQFSSGPWEEMQKANAALIAAAPDMLEALRNVQKIIAEGAMTGFNCHDGDWSERLFFSQQKTSAAIKAALSPLSQVRGDS